MGEISELLKSRKALFAFAPITGRGAILSALLLAGVSPQTSLLVHKRSSLSGSRRAT